MTLTPVLVVVDDFDAMSVTIPPDETNPILVVDPDRVLPGAVTSECFQPIARRRLQIMKRLGLVDQKQLAAGDPGKALPVPVTNARGQKCLGVLAPVREDHGTCYPLRQA
jgi:hypothetical protein